MKAMAIRDFGGPEALELMDLAVPEPGPGEVRVRMAWACVNPADWKSRAGWLRALPIYKPRFPLVIGLDGSGWVDKLGPGVSGPAPGTPVFGRSQHSTGAWGTYAEYTVTTVDAVARCPPGWTWPTRPRSPPRRWRRGTAFSTLAACNRARPCW
jgi:NADPH2:quinone reductase